MSTLAVYPGSFDPLTNGHVDIIMRGARLFDRIIVAILVNLEKLPLFTVGERVEIAAPGAGHRAGAPRPFRFRIRVPDGADEPAAEW